MKLIVWEWFCEEMHCRYGIVRKTKIIKERVYYDYSEPKQNISEKPR
jgi:hypothetical protein